jgi:hypothetical protein
MTKKKQLTYPADDMVLDHKDRCLKFDTEDIGHVLCTADSGIKETFT